MTWYNQTWAQAGRMEFRRIFKREFYAYCYSSALGNAAMKDFMLMYQMGGEL